MGLGSSKEENEPAVFDLDAEERASLDVLCDQAARDETTPVFLADSRNNSEDVALAVRTLLRQLNKVVSGEADVEAHGERVRSSKKVVPELRSGALVQGAPRNKHRVALLVLPMHDGSSRSVLVFSPRLWRFTTRPKQQAWFAEMQALQQVRTGTPGTRTPRAGA